MSVLEYKAELPIYKYLGIWNFSKPLSTEEIPKPPWIIFTLNRADPKALQLCVSEGRFHSKLLSNARRLESGFKSKYASNFYLKHLVWSINLKQLDNIFLNHCDKCLPSTQPLLFFFALSKQRGDIHIFPLKSATLHIVLCVNHVFNSRKILRNIFTEQVKLYFPPLFLCILPGIKSFTYSFPTYKILQHYFLIWVKYIEMENFC